MKNSGVMTHNPFRFATRDMPKSHRVEARFELRARIQGQIDAIDKDIALAIKERKPYLVESLTLRRNRMLNEMP